MTDCIQYASIADIQAIYGDDVSDMTDGQIQRQIDALAAALEESVGHTFGRAAVVRSTGADTVQVTSTGVVVGGDTYLFATYGTLYSLAAAINGAGEAYNMEVLPQVRQDTPSTLLKVLAATPCGPDYEDRAVLCLTARYEQLDGGSSHVFLDLPLASVSSVSESGTALTSSYYWAQVGETWLIRKRCTCATANTCQHPRGTWKSTYPGNVLVQYVPVWWGRVPVSVQATLTEAFGVKLNLGAAGDGSVVAESFGEYSYRKAGPSFAGTWRDVLSGGSSVRQYQIRFHP